MKIYIVLSFLLCVVVTSFAQHASVASGADASGSGGTISYSIGQVVNTTNIGTSFSIAEGVQQPYEISVTVGINNSNIQLGAMIYPNPTTNYIVLKTEGYPSKELSYQLFDQNGKLIVSKQIISNSERIEMQNLAASTYFLKVIENQTVRKVFKIAKN